VRLTDRDRKLVRDLVLSHVMSRDQFIALGYFGSVTRCNTRLRELKEAGMVRTIDTPFHVQHLYAAGKKAPQIVGERLSGLAASRTASPRFLQHALCVNNVRIRMVEKGATWRFEQQATATFRYGGKDWQVRPDGLAVRADSSLVAVEIDLGHVAPSKFAEKLRAYDAFVVSRECQSAWRAPRFDVLTVTTGKIRANSLAKQRPKEAAFALTCLPFEKLGIQFAGGWS